MEVGAFKCVAVAESARSTQVKDSLMEGRQSLPGPVEIKLQKSASDSVAPLVELLPQRHNYHFPQGCIRQESFQRPLLGTFSLLYLLLREASKDYPLRCKYIELPGSIFWMSLCNIMVKGDWWPISVSPIRLAHASKALLSDTFSLAHSTFKNNSVLCVIKFEFNLSSVLVMI